MKKILYIVSTLKKSGPTNQLFNVIKNLDTSEFDILLVTLSPETSDSRWQDFDNLGVKLISLNLSRVQGLLNAKNKLKKLFKMINPDIIHTQGIRADSLVSTINSTAHHVATIHNFAPEDYLTKFGGFKGKVMVRHHFKTMKRIKYLIACSNTIHHKLTNVGIVTHPIQNGVEVNLENTRSVPELETMEKPILISVGSLIPRKNMGVILNAFNSLPETNRGSLVILGDGPQMPALQNLAINNVHLLGNVSNVHDYLASSDYFVSSSLSEGLPNTVLEALSVGVPVILSDIESHKEIAQELKKSCSIFSLKDGIKSLADALLNAPNLFDQQSREEAVEVTKKVFSAESMSTKYQEYYKKVLS